MWTRALYITAVFCILSATLSLIATVVIYNKSNQELVKGRLGIVIDAGGSGTRLSVFEYRKEDGMHRIDYINCEDKGLATYKNNPADFKDLLTKCLTNANKDVPSDTRQNVPLYMEATAGMRILRILNETTYHRMWDVVREALNKSQYNFKHAGTLSGGKEGIGAWGALNYLNGGFKSQKLSGALEMGSTSLQVTFLPKKKDFVGENETFSIDNKQYKAYVHSYLCYGRNAFERRYLAKLVIDQYYSSTVSDPCGHIGNKFNKTSDYLWAAPCSSGSYALKTFGGELKGPLGRTYTFKGRSNPNECLKSIAKLIDVTHCKHSSCGFYGVAQPPVHGDFTAFGAFYYPPSALNMSRAANRTEYEAAVKKTCSMTAAQVKTLPIPAKYRYTYCLSSAYEYMILTKGIHFNDTTWKIKFLKKINGNSITWSLGYQLLKKSEMSQDVIRVSRPFSKTMFTIVTAACCVVALTGIVIFVFTLKKRAHYATIAKSSHVM